ncbi:MAG: AsmA-like C-terminal region-containing protein [Chlorobi bacterium]|nr:AsmA-like C-terminal region-containing protein [Chlorobiota bacterium]
MKTFFKILGILVLIIIALMFILPLVFEGKIEELARQEINKNVNAKVDFKDINLSLFKNFPNFTLGIDGLTVIGKDVFEKDTLAKIQNTSVTINLFSVFRGGPYKITKFSINSPVIKVRILENGLPNYDIAMPSEPAEETVETGQEDPFELILNNVSVNNGRLTYLDEESDVRNVRIYANGLNNSLSGGLTANTTVLHTKTTIEHLTVESGGMNYLTDARLRYQASINADLKNEIYTLGKNELILNDLLLNFDGSVSFLDEGMNLVLTFNAPKNKFKSILSLVPAAYLKDFEGIETNGDFSLNGSVKGIYNDEKLPSFNVNLKVNNGYFKYPDLPKAVENINIKTTVYNPGGNEDATVINIPEFNMTMGGNPVKASLILKTPVSDPEIDGKIKGEIDLSTVKDFYPLENGENLSGVFVTDITLRGKMSSIENEQYDKFIAMGTMLVRDMTYTSPSFQHPVNISSAQLNFSPQYLDLVAFKMKTGNSDFSARGKINNYLSYVFADGKLKGTLRTNSKYFNVDELLTSGREAEMSGEETPDKETTTKQDTTGSVVKIPENIDFVLTSRFDKLVWDNLNMAHVSGQIIVRDEAMDIKNLKSDISGGQMTVNGQYSTKNTDKPDVSLNLKLSALDIPSSYDEFALVRKYLPVAKKTKGKLSAGFSLTTKLDKEMVPVYETMNGQGQLTTTQITIDGLNTLVEIANELDFNELKKLTLEKVNISFRFINGKLITKPFTLKYKDFTADVEGWTGIDQSIEYAISLNIPREKLGSGANDLLDDLAKEAKKYGLDYELPKTIKVGVTVSGTLSDPKIKTGLKQSSDDLVKKAKEEIAKEVSKELRKQAQKIRRPYCKANYG